MASKCVLFVYYKGVLLNWRITFYFLSELSPVTFPYWLQLPAPTPPTWPRFYYETVTIMSYWAARPRWTQNGHPCEAADPSTTGESSSVHFSHFSVAVLRCRHKRAEETTVLDSLTWYLNVSIKQDYLIFGHQRLKFLFSQWERNYRMHNNKWDLISFSVFFPHHMK